uniref:Uncharacterized protein n=1 Tax=Tanacetum cinerariifolium TaxID=118510 RepID=A0A6L2M819_TANCI|nr:hypothetical protein [Tanacetum cinerariifolium]
MSGAGTLSKKTISDEPASTKEHMSFENEALSKIVFAQPASSSSALFLDELQGNAIHCTTKSNIAHNLIKLKEGGIYSIKNFVVYPNKEEYRIRKEDTFMLEFEGDTRAWKSLAKSDDLSCILSNCVTSYSCKQYILDVARYITNVGRSIQQRTSFRTLDFYLANQRCLELHYWEGVMVDMLIEKKTKDVGHSSTLILDDASIPALKELRSEIRYMLELGVSDETGHVVVVMLDETTSKLVKCSADSIAQAKEESLDDNSDLPVALTNIIGTTNTLELKSHAYYEHGTFESFTCWKLISPEAAVKSAGSSTVDVVPDVSSSSGKRLCKQPFEEFDDSDADSLPSRAERKKKKLLAPVAHLSHVSN